MYGLREGKRSNEGKAVSIHTSIHTMVFPYLDVKSVMGMLLSYLILCRYPSLGTRFVHSSQGELLVKRIVLCPSCSPFATRQRQTRDDSHTNHELTDNGGSRMKWVTLTLHLLLSHYSITLFRKSNSLGLSPYRLIKHKLIRISFGRKIDHYVKISNIRNRSKTLNELSTLHSSSISTFSIEECMEAARIRDKKVRTAQTSNRVGSIPYLLS